MGHGTDMGTFTEKDQITLKSIIVAKNDFTEQRYNDAFANLSRTDAGTVEKWLGKPAPGAQITYTTQGSGTFAAPKGTAVIDCRTYTTSPTGFSAQKESPYKIKNSLYCGGDIGKSNISLFNTALVTFQQAKITTQPAEQILFYDTGGHHRAPEMCLRYIDFLLTNPDPNIKKLLGKQYVYFLDGGMTDYQKKFPKSNFLEDWPNKKANGGTGSL